MIEFLKNEKYGFFNDEDEFIEVDFYDISDYRGTKYLDKMGFYGGERDYRLAQIIEKRILIDKK